MNIEKKIFFYFLLSLFIIRFIVPREIPDLFFNQVNSNIHDVSITIEQPEGNSKMTTKGVGRG